MNEGIEKAVLESARLMNEFALTDKTIAYPGAGLPDREKIIRLTEELRSCMFPGYFGCPAPRQNPFAAGFKLSAIAAGLEKQALAALSACGGKEDAQKRAEDTVEHFLTELPNVQWLLATDVEALFDGDPAAISRTDVIFSYPGLFAITIYRLAHVLYNQNLPLIPRMMTEYAHGQTGIDINAGAKIREALSGRDSRRAIHARRSASERRKAPSHARKPRHCVLRSLHTRRRNGHRRRLHNRRQRVRHVLGACGHARDPQG